MRIVMALVAGLAGCGRAHFGAVADASIDGPDAPPDATPDASTALVADAGPDQMVAYVPCNTMIEIDPRGSHDPDGTIVGCTAYFTAGSSTGGGNCGSLLAAQVYIPGVYPVILQVTDNDGNVATDTTTITVVDANHPPPGDALPHWSAGPSQSVTANTLVTFDFSASWNPDGQHYYNFEMDFGDGSASGSTALACTHTYTTVGSYTAAFTLDNSTLPPAQWPMTSVAVTVN